MLDREPKDAPYAVGTRLRYYGDSECYAIRRQLVDGKVQEIRLPIIVPGMEVTISRVTKGHRGTLRHVCDSDGPMYDDQGEPVLDETEDSHSVFDSPGGGRLIRWDSCDIDKWEVIRGAVRS